jgi:hypothetical protein
MLSREMALTASGPLRAAAGAAIVALLVSACGVSGPDPAACKGAMQASYVKALAGQGQFDPDPAACKGLPKAQVQRFARQVQAGSRAAAIPLPRRSRVTETRG